MNTAVLITTKILTLSLLSSGVFLASSIVAPLKTETRHQESHVPRMNISFTEFSPSWSAFEDDYSVSDQPEEKIPAHVKATHLAAGQVDMMDVVPTQKVSLPSLSMAANSQADEIEMPHAIPTQVNAKIEKQLVPRQDLQADTGIRAPHHWLQGKIELTGGLAITDPRDQIHIGWMVDGKMERTGKIDLQGGVYEIKVDRFEGDLIAELVDRKGYLLGEAVIDLEQLSRQVRHDQIVIKNVDVQLTPYQFGFKGQTVSIYDSPISKSPVDKVNVRVGKHDLNFQSEKSGNVESQSVSPHSTAMITASRSQFRDTLMLADFEKKQKIRMFPEKFVKALFDTVKLDARDRNAGMVWGLVTKEQSPAAGYTVRLAKHPEATAIYFNMYIASREQKQTSADGQYVFVGIAEGEYEVEVFNSVDQKVDSKLVSVKPGFVSQAEFEVATKKTVALRPFDPLSSGLKDVQLATQGSDAIHELKTEEILKIPVLDGTDPYLIYARPADSKTDTSVFASRGRKFLDVPVLNTTWWERIQSENKITTKNGVVIGFIDTDAPFEVFVEESGPETVIRYFNHSGQLIPEGSNQLANGFLIYNAGEGLKTLILQSESGWITTEMAYLDGETVSLMYKAL